MEGFIMDTTQLTEQQLAGMLDHTLLKPYATRTDYERLCAESRAHHFAMVAIHSAPVALCKELLKGSGVHVGAAISFPHGLTTVQTKLFETRTAIADGADEIDYVIHIGKLKEGNLAYLEDEMSQIVSVCKDAGVISKVIFETCYLTKEEIIALAEVAARVRPDFIKTSTGFGTAGATAEHVTLMKQVVGSDVKVKAAGGIRSWATCKAMLEAGAERIGTSSSLTILEEFRAERRA
jgi:deoxyribose-phosphate aldolase